MVQDISYIEQESISISYETNQTHTTSLILHEHEVFEIYYLTKGKRYMWVDGNNYIINAGDIILIPSNKKHATKSYGTEPHSRIVVNFHKQYINNLLHDMKELDLISIFYPNEKVFTLPLSQRQEVERIFVNIQKELTCALPGYSIAIRLNLLSLLLILVRKKEYIKDVNKTKKASVNYMERIIEFINVNYQEKLDLNTLSDLFFINPSALSRSFRKYTGVNFSEYVNNKRITEAKQLLKNTDISIMEICASTGYNNLPYFEKTFKAHIGLSPSKYRTSVKNGE
ncbi:helix-turn-helix domain-containing protein [Clostridium sp. YIM B02515]|uniref:Helix-turn-helix domain-containing protein n=1 Tax=Clostridium rhizosphaerae TaxID=2803861 RepID=A0ABS1TEN6_9CLOT|nr:AraC family transcriptional regulator [Clostridium rhizosphaerae]MBL4937830.1 helix-turn-helix domain-containing protein [Clostridium rhizosphaerae]